MLKFLGKCLKYFVKGLIQFLVRSKLSIEDLIELLLKLLPVIFIISQFISSLEFIKNYFLSLFRKTVFDAENHNPKTGAVGVIYTDGSHEVVKPVVPKDDGELSSMVVKYMKNILRKCVVKKFKNIDNTFTIVYSNGDVEKISLDRPAVMISNENVGKLEGGNDND